MKNKMITLKAKNFLNNILQNDGIEMQMTCSELMNNLGDKFDPFQIRQAARRLLIGSKQRAVAALNVKPFYCAHD